MPTPSTAAATALTATQRRWSFRYEAISGDATTKLRDLTVESCRVANNSLADKVKRTCDVSLAGSTRFDQLSELFRPFAILTDPSTNTSTEWCLGTFLLSSNVSTSLVAPGQSSAKFVGYDRLLVLDDDKVTDRYVLAAGTVVTTAISTLLTSANLPTIGVTTSSKTLPAALEWEPGTTKLKIVNDLLGSIGYASLSVDELGTPIVAPYVDPSAAPIVWAYAADARSVILPGVDTTLDLFSVPNRWTAYVSEPDRPVLTSTYTNANPNSPTSTVSRGRVIADVVQLQQTTGEAPPVDQATLDAKVLQLAQEASQVYSDVEFSTGLMPFHGDAEVFTLDVGSGAIRYREHTWAFDLVAGGKMTHRFRRVVAI